MVNLGPQFVQLMNGYKYRLSFLSKSSFRQSSQIEMSGDICNEVFPPFRSVLFFMIKIFSNLGGIFLTIIFVIFDCWGGCNFNFLEKFLMLFSAPSISIKTPSAVFETKPARFSDNA